MQYLALRVKPLYNAHLWRILEHELVGVFRVDHVKPCFYKLYVSLCEGCSSNIFTPPSLD